MQTLHQSLYHKVLRVAALVAACVLVFESGAISGATITLSQNTHQYVANAVGMSAAVERTEINTLTAELTEQKVALAEREATLAAREIEVGLIESSTSRTDYGTYFTAGILFILLVLIVLNYALDYVHRRESMQALPARG